MAVRNERIKKAIGALENGGRVLLTRLQYLGDVVLTLPVVDAIRNRYPRAEIDYLCRWPVSDWLEGDARFSRVYSVRPAAGLGAGLSLVNALRKRRYDVVIDLYSNPRSAWLSWLSGAKLRVGGDRRGRRALYTHPVSVAPGIRSAIDHHMAYAGVIDVRARPGKPVAEPAAADVERARDLLENHGVETRRPDGPRIGIHPGGKWEVKRWPTERFAAAIEELSDGWNATVVVFTGPGEKAYTDRLRETSPATAVYLPEMSIRTAAAVLSMLDGMIVSDGGIMHLSVAVGTPTVGIFGSAEPDVWFPYEAFGPYAPAFVPLKCRPCHRHVCPLGHTDCLRTLSHESVLATLRRVLTGGGGDCGGARNGE